MEFNISWLITEAVLDWSSNTQLGNEKGDEFCTLLDKHDGLGEGGKFLISEGITECTKTDRHSQLQRISNHK